MGHRAWFAWHCLERDAHGQPPSLRSLEASERLANNSLSKLIYDKLKRPGWSRLEQMARALRVEPQWLLDGQGSGPVAKWPVGPRPDAPRGRQRNLPTAPTISIAAAAKFERDAKKLSQGVAGARRHSTRK